VLGGTRLSVVGGRFIFVRSREYERLQARRPTRGDAFLLDGGSRRAQSSISL
jgi:hypothetical protein